MTWETDLMAAPLLDSEGRTAFFLGGQINCSTTIHSCSDILRLLSMSDDSEIVDDQYLGSPPPSKSGGSGLNGFFKALRGKNGDKPSDTRDAGIEQKLLNKIERMNFKDQMEAFYTTYSKVCHCQFATSLNPITTAHTIRYPTVSCTRL